MRNKCEKIRQLENQSTGTFQIKNDIKTKVN